MSDLIERLRKLVVLDEVGSNNNLANEAADEIERLTKENEELRNELQQALHDLMVRETAKDEEIAALKAKQESAEPVAFVDAGHLREVSNGNEMLIWASPEQDDYKRLEPVYLYPTAAIESFKRKIVWMLDTITADVRFQSKDCYRMADQLRHDIAALPGEVKMAKIRFDDHNTAYVIESLRQQLAEAQRDAERYRWLKPRMYVGVSRLKKCLWCIDGLFENPNMTLDETIDAAIANAMRGEVE